MTSIVGLLIISFVLFFFEIFLPGGVLAIIGGLVLLIASAMAFTEWGFAAAVGLFFFGVLGAILMFFIEVKLISQTRFGRQFALKSTIATRLNPRADEKLVGAEGVTLTKLAPSGKVEIGGAVYTAAAEDGFLDKGISVSVSRTETFHLIVKAK